MAVLALTIFATISSILIVPPLLVGIATDLEISVADVISPARRAQAVGGLWAIQGLASVISIPLVALLANVGYAGIGYMCLAVTIVSALLTGQFGRQFGESAGQSKG